MTTPERISGVLSPVVTPFNRDLMPDAVRLAQQCRWLLSENVRLAVFGTNSEANSLSVGEKIDLLDHLIEAGISGSALVPGTGCCSTTDSIALTRHAVKLGCAGVLMLPPFYYKGVSDDGLYDFFAHVIDKVGDERLRVYLYHIPPVSQVPLSLDLIERLVRDFPETVVGIKDSSGDWSNTRALIDRGWDDFRVFAGSETFLLQTMRQGGAGCISATANVNPRAIHHVFANWQSAQADRLQADLDAVRGIFQKFPMIPALKAAISHHASDQSWRIVRPPLRALNAEQQTSLVADLQAIGFRMDGLREAGT